MSNPRLPQVAAILTALALLATATAAQSPARSTRGKAAAKSIGAQPLTFEEHRAPGATRRTFVSRGAGYTLSLTPAAAELTLPRTDLALRMTLQGANRSAPMHGLEPQAPIYHVTQASRGALTGTPTYGRVHYSSVYRGIDLVYYGNDRQLEFDFLVAPHADPKKIRFSIDGADALSLTPDGELSLRSRDHEFRLRKPLIYQSRGGIRQEIHGGYRVLDAKRRIIGFELGRYDRSQPLVIDPTIVFATYLGGADEDYPNTLAVDAIGNIYLFADTRDPSTLPSDLVVQPEPLAPPQAGFGQCLLTKLNPDGANAEYSILFEGAQCQAMALDRSTLSSERRIHVAVGTSFHYQRTITESPYTGLTIGLLNGAYDACQLGSCGPTEWMGTDSSGNVYFVMNLGAPHELRKIDAAGSPLGALVLLDPPLHPLPDGSRAIYDQIRAFDVDESGVFYAAAVVTEPGLITPTADALQPTRPSASCTDPSLSACWDGAILVVDTNAPGNFQFRYASYLGGRDYDYVAAIAHDPDQPGVVYVTGNSASSDFPTTPGSYNTQAPFNGGAGVTFVTKLDLAAGNPPAFQRKFSTFIGSAYSYPQALTPLPGGAGVAVVGVASDDPCPPFTCFPLVNSLYPKRSQQEMRPYVAALSADGAALSFSSYLDSTLHTDGFAFDVANNGSQLLYVAMTTNDPSLGTSGTLQPSNRGQHDVLVQAIDVSTILAPNDAPEIVFTPSVIQTTAIDLNGALVPIICGKLFACSITDADGDQIEHLAWLGPNNFRVAATGLPASGSADIVPQAYLALPVGTHTLTLRARDTAGRIGSASLTVNVSGVNTFPGQAQTVTLTDPKFVVFGAAGQGSEHPIDVTFDAVTQAGLTYLESLPGAVPPPPVGWQAGSPPYVYDLKSTAAFAPGVQVCFNTRGMSFARPQGDLQIFQLVNGAWTPLPGQTQPDPFRICGHTVTLGRFVILYPEVPATRITTYAGTGCAENSRDGAGGDPCDDFAAVAEATQSSLTRPGRIAVDPAGAIYVADNGGSPDSGIRRIDPNTHQITTAVPAGVCDGFGPLAIDPGTGDVVCTQSDLATGYRSIVSYGRASGIVTPRLAVWSGEIRALAFDTQGNLFFADTQIHRIPAAGGLPQLVAATYLSGGPTAPHVVQYLELFSTLAFDRDGCLLAGGLTLSRICPGADGVVDGSADESLARVAGVTSADWFSYSQPFGGDGFPAIDALVSFTYQMIVASDGAVVFTDQTGRIRRIDPGSDGVITGEADETVRTIAGYVAFSIPDPTPYASSEYGDFRGLAEDPFAPGRFFVSSHTLHKVQRFGLSDADAGAAQADLAVTISTPADQSHVDLNAPVTFTAVTENRGPSAAPAAQLTTTFPSGFEFVEASVSGGSCVNDAVHVSCALPAMASGESVTTQVVLRPTVTGPAALSFTVNDGSTPDPNGANNTATVRLTVDAATVHITVEETIVVHDAIVPLPAAMVVVNESIAITDTIAVLPAAMITWNETIHVADGNGIRPAALIAIEERIGVTDTPTIAPQTAPQYTVTLTPATAETGTGDPVTWTALSSDGTDEEARVVLLAANGNPRIQYRNPGAANAPLSVSVSGTDIIVSLATAADGSLTTTAAQLAAALNASSPVSALLAAAPWPGRAGTGTVQPRALAPLAVLRIQMSGTGAFTTCRTTLAGWCVMTATLSTPGSAAVEAFLDVNENGVREAVEPFATAQATWVDRTPPVLSLPANTGAQASSTAGVVVSYDATAVDAIDGQTPLTCTPASGTTFPIGTTTVVCTARDRAGNTASGSFTVTVSTSSTATLQVGTPVVFLTSSTGQYVGALTLINNGIATAGTVQLTSAVLNTTSAGGLPVSFGSLGPGARVTKQITFPASAGAAGSANLKLGFTWAGGSVSIAQRVVLPAASAPLWGWADLHTHPMSNLAFGGKLFHGGPDVGSLLPAVQMSYDPKCRPDVRAISIDEALSDDAPTHGDPIQSKCGDFVRNGLVQALEEFNEALRQPGHAVGSPTFLNWPRWNDITHQKMWIDWIRRARDGGLRVMVALSHNNRTLAELIGSGGPISGVRDDKASSDLQIAEIKAFAARHPDLMKVVLTSNELYQTVQDGKIAVLLGIEVDNIGDFNDLSGVSTTTVANEIDRLYAQGVRYIFPVHLTDNVFGDTAIYSTLFNVANRRETGSFWTIGCANAADDIGYRSATVLPLFTQFLPAPWLQIPGASNCVASNGTFLGHVNIRTASGLTSLGEFAVKAMMQRGMIIDVDHMSNRAVNDVLTMAEAIPGGGYPLVSGHSAIRDRNRFNAENSRSRTQLQRIGCLQGMFGLGTDGAEAYDWASQYMDAVQEMAKPTSTCSNSGTLGKGRVAFGTDTNSLVRTARPTLIDMRPGTLPRYTDIYNPASPANDNPLLPALPRSSTGVRTWDYNIDGVAHYGMFADFVKDVRTAPASAALATTGKDLVDNYLLRSADYFFRMWQRIEAQKANVR